MAVELYSQNGSGLWLPDGASRSLENPAVPLRDPAVLENFGIGSGRGGSIVVTERSILRYGPVYRAVNLLSDSFAKLPLDVFVRLSPRGKSADVSHSAYRALRRKPNERQTAFIFKKQISAAAIIYGNGYAFVDRSGPRIKLLFLSPDRTRPFEDNRGVLWYETFVGPNMERRVLFPDEVLHLRGLGQGDAIAGVPMGRLMASTAQLGLSAEKYGIKFFDNGARSSGVLTFPPKHSKSGQRAMKASAEETKQGLDNASKLMILRDGARYQPLTIAQDEAQFLETREFQAKEVAVWFGIPPNKLGDSTRTSYNSLEQENQAYLDEGLDPWLCNFEDECWDKLLSEEEKDNDSHVIEFNRRALIQANLTDRFEAYNKSILSGWLLRDEARDAENYNPIPDGEGEKFMIPANMSVVGEESELGADGGSDPQQASPDVDIQATAMNGAQVAALLEIVAQVTAGMLPKDAAKALISAAFPLIPKNQIDGIVDEIDVNGGQDDANESDDEPQSDAAARLLLLDTLRRMAAMEASAIDRAAKRKTGLSVAEECEKHGRRLTESLRPVLAVVAPWYVAERCVLDWYAGSLAICESGGSLERVSEERCCRMINQVFEART